MISINRHKFLLAQILGDFFSSLQLANCLGFKGGTAMMFFYDLPRFSTDLDFNLLKPEMETAVFNEAREILSKYGHIHDEAIKYFGPILVLDYEKGERKLKVEISNRQYDNHYEIKNFFGTSIKTMTEPDMFAHKLCALLDRPSITSRDIFDSWFFMKNHVPLNKFLVETRMKMTLDIYLSECITAIEKIPRKNMLHGLGELMDNKMKDFVRTRLKEDVLALLELYRNFPIVGDE
jgi:predicted nucleotidyltransferase component of viral defense system